MEALAADPQPSKHSLGTDDEGVPVSRREMSPACAGVEFSSLNINPMAQHDNETIMHEPARWGFRRTPFAPAHAFAEERLADAFGWNLGLFQGRNSIGSTRGSGAYDSCILPPSISRCLP